MPENTGRRVTAIKVVAKFGARPAQERQPGIMSEPISTAAAALPRLTELSATAGCAAKIAQVDLHRALTHLPAQQDPRVVVGHQTGDDAAVYQLSEDVALVETVDIVTPIVDDPYDYGRIAAANALSDIYAMGARPISALSFVAWPMAARGPDELGQILRGAADVCRQADIVIAGGHSIVDSEPKFGLFVTGLSHPEAIVTNAGGRPGDVLVLTKALGTGVLSTAAKRGQLPQVELRQAIESMATLNRAACEAMLAVGVQACTDVTGFGLLGHLGNILRASSMAAGRAIGARIHLDEVPWLDRAVDLAAENVCPGGTRRNLEFAAPHVNFSSTVTEHMQLLLADAQTSGGLLIAVAPSRLDWLLVELAHRDVLIRAVIGELLAVDDPCAIAVV